jgi:hypothetical protein
MATRGIRYDIEERGKQIFWYYARLVLLAAPPHSIFS